MVAPVVAAMDRIGSGRHGAGIMNNVNEVSWSALVKGTLIANIGTFLYGYDIGITSWIILELIYRADSPLYTSLGTTNGQDNYYEIVGNSDAIKGTIVSISTYGGAFVYYILMFYGNEISKRSEMQLAAFLYFIGSIMCAISLNIEWYGAKGQVALGLLLVGLLLFGGGFAATFHSVPQYLTELCPRKLRGRIGASVEVGIVTGVAFGQCIGYLFCSRASHVDHSATDWSNMFKVSILISAFYGILIQYIPMEIDFMLKNGWTNLEGKVVMYTRAEVLSAIQFIYPRANDETISEFQLRLKKVKYEEENWQRIYDTHLFDEECITDGNNSGFSYFSSLKNWVWNNTRLEVKILFADDVMRRVLVVGFCFKLLELLCGMQPLLWDMGEIFVVLSPNNVGQYLLGLSFVKAITAFVMILLMDALPRRTWLGIGQSIIILFLILSVIFFHQGKYIATIWCIYATYAGWEIGFGSISWIILNEIFPKFVRFHRNKLI